MTRVRASDLQCGPGEGEMALGPPDGPLLAECSPLTLRLGEPGSVLRTLRPSGVGRWLRPADRTPWPPPLGEAAQVAQRIKGKGGLEAEWVSLAREG